MSTSNTKTTIKALYPSSKITKNSDKALWVVFPAGDPTNAMVYGSKLTRDQVRTAGSNQFGIYFNDIRAQRLSNYRRTISTK